ncbi:MAG: hypothetical protein RSC33_06180 [Vagococcus sp.]
MFRINNTLKKIFIPICLIGLSSSGVAFAMISSLESKLNSTTTIKTPVVVNQTNRTVNKHQPANNFILHTIESGETLPDGTIDANQAASIGINMLIHITGFDSEKIIVTMNAFKDPHNRWLWSGNVNSEQNNNALSFLIDAITGDAIYLNNSTNNEYSHTIDYNSTDYNLFNTEEAEKQDDYIDEAKTIASLFTNESIVSIQFNYAGLGKSDTSTYKNMTFIATTTNGQECSISFSPSEKKVTSIFIVTPEIPGALG